MEHRETNVPWSTPPELWEKLKPLARQMRMLPTPAEEALWQRLRNRQVGGWKFRRQHTMDRFVVDFYCPEARLIIEVDGAVHEYTQDEDALRTEFLESMGMRVSRFSNDDVLGKMEAVLARIGEILSQATD
jgi:very-short-patch-repair endonuclease